MTDSDFEILRNTLMSLNSNRSNRNIPWSCSLCELRHVQVIVVWSLKSSLKRLSWEGSTFCFCQLWILLKRNKNHHTFFFCFLKEREQTEPQRKTFDLWPAGSTRPLTLYHKAKYCTSFSQRAATQETHNTLRHTRTHLNTFTHLINMRIETHTERTAWQHKHDSDDFDGERRAVTWETTKKEKPTKMWFWYVTCANALLFLLYWSWIIFIWYIYIGWHSAVWVDMHQPRFGKASRHYSHFCLADIKMVPLSDPILRRYF